MAVLIQAPAPVNVGVDVGQIHDPTAICITEITEQHTGKYRYITPEPMRQGDHGQWMPPRDADPIMVSQFTVRYIARLTLGTSYPDVAMIIADLLSSPLLAGRRVRVFIDVTGVGRPVYEDLHLEIKRRKETRDVLLKPISFAHGEKYNKSTGVLGKAFLVSKLQSLLQAGRVHAPATPEVRATLDELRVYEIKIDQDGKDKYGAFQVGAHDDLATALGLSCLEDPFGDRVRYSERVY